MRRRKSTTKKYYCPQCGYKTLIQEMNWSASSEGDKGWYQTWSCTRNLSSNRIARAIEKGWVYPGVNKTKEEALEIMKSKVAAAPPCNCKIKTPGRDAEISDYGTLLDKVARVGNEFKDWALATDHTINKKGFDIIHQTDFMVVVRLRNNTGIGAWCYWEDERVERTQGINNVETKTVLQHKAATYVKFRGVSLYSIFNNKRYCLWKKENITNKYHSYPYPFNGKSIGKRMRSEMIEWAVSFEEKFPELLKEAKQQRKRWLKEEFNLKSQIESITDKIKIIQYNGEYPSCKLDLPRVTPEEARKIAQILEGRSIGV
jgi:hypothetical protein